jgi:hypothetical protein
MTDHESEEQVAQLLAELGPADPPAGFVAKVMARISLEQRKQVTGRVVPFHKGGIAMTRKAMWGLAAAATILLVVFAVRGFPPVGRGTEGTVGAAKKYQEPQIAAKDVVLGDAAAQEFLQSEAFDQLVKDPQARTFLADSALNAYLKKQEFLDAIKSNDVRTALHSELLAKIFADSDARNAVEDAIKANAAGAAVRQASADAAVKSSARALVARAFDDAALAKVLNNAVLRSAMADSKFRGLMRSDAAAAALSSQALAKAVAQNGFNAAAMSGRLEAALISR